MTMAHTDLMMVIVQSRSAEALIDVRLVDGNDGCVGAESTSTWSPCRLQHPEGLPIEQGVERSVRLHQLRQKRTVAQVLGMAQQLSWKVGVPKARKRQP